MSAVVGFGLIGVLIYLAASCLITLGFLAAWNTWRPPKHWQVIVATVILVFVPMLANDLNDLVYSFDAPDTRYRIWLAFKVAIASYVPVLIPALLWALQRRGENGRFSRIARIAGSLLVAYVVLVVLILPVAFFVLVFSYGQTA